MLTKLDRIAEKAQRHSKERLTSLAHVLSKEFLIETWKQMNRKGAPGIDGIEVAEYAQNLSNNIESLQSRLFEGRYKAPPVRRVEIPRGDGRTRPLGIPTIEDRLLQRAVGRLLSPIYEQDFLGCSYGFRVKRSPHQALKQLRSYLIGGQVMHVFEADIRSYFDKVNHEWLMKMIEHRIADPIILRLIRKWLRAGVMIKGVRTGFERGTPQGGPISPLLANIYLHYVFDLWFEKVYRKQSRGRVYLVRFADDFVVCFQYQSDANKFRVNLEERFAKFDLQLAPEKTRQLIFGRFARERLKPGKPGEFVFLGFRHICGVDRQGRFGLVRLPADKPLKEIRVRIKTWLKGHRHWRVKDQSRYLHRVLTGFFNYFALPHCGKKLYGLVKWVYRQWWKALKSRSQRGPIRYWSFILKQDWFTLPTPKSIHGNV